MERQEPRSIEETPWDGNVEARCADGQAVRGACRCRNASEAEEDGEIETGVKQKALLVGVPIDEIASTAALG